MAFENIINSVINNFIVNKNQSILYLSLPETFMNQLRGIVNPGYRFLDLADDNAPLKPFLNILSERKPSEELVKKIAYPLHVKTLNTYFKTGHAEERMDKFILEEIYYEKVMLSNAVSELMAKLENGTFFILNAQEMGLESIDILKKLEKNVFKGKLIFCFNSMRIDNASDGCKEFYRALSDSNIENFYDISDLLVSTEQINNSPVYLMPTFESLLGSLKNCIELLSLDQGYSLLKWINSNSDSLNFKYEQKRELYLEMGIICFLKGLTDEATFFINNVLEKGHDDDIEIKATYYLASILTERSANNTALKYARLLQQKLEKDKDNPYYALSVMQDYIITEQTSLDKYSNEELSERYKRTISLLKANECENNASKVSLVIPIQLVENPDTVVFIESCIDEALSQTEKLRNYFGLSTACHWKGIVLSKTGRQEDALSWYYRCSELRASIGQVTSLMKIRNGISYEMLIRTNFKEAYNLINSFVDQLIEIDDYAEVIITLNNLSRAIFYARQYAEANRLIQKIIHLLFLFDLKETALNSFVPEYNDILLYKTIIDFNNKDYIRAKINLHNIIHNGKQISQYDTCFVHLNQAFVSLHEGKLEKANTYMEFVEKDFSAMTEGQPFRLVFCYYEYANALSVRSEEPSKEVVEKSSLSSIAEFRSKCLELSDYYFQKGFKIAQKYHFDYFTQGKEKLNVKEYIAGIEQFSPVNLDLEKLEERAENRRLMNQLDQRVRDSQFLNKVVSYNIDNTNRITYVKNVIEAVFDYTGAEAVFIAEKSEIGWDVMAQISRSEPTIPSDLVWEKNSEEAKKDTTQRMFKIPGTNYIYCNLSKFEFEGAIIIAQSKQVESLSDDNNILNIALLNIQAQLVMIKQNEHLLYISSTDQLSMLKNRRALQEHLALESEMIRRYEMKKNLHMNESIAFIDLDNFKYYNDTFGHEAGDLFISCFARLLKQVYRKVDFVSRFGGDEFVVVLPNTTSAEAKRAAERLQEGLLKAECFIPDLESLLGKKLDVDPKYHLGFSMGICSNSDATALYDMETTMINADHALYYSKQHGKGCVTIWSDIKNSIATTEDNVIDLNNENG